MNQDMPAKSTTLTRSAVTVVSAFSSGKGVTFGIDIPCKVSAELRTRKANCPEISVKGQNIDSQGLVTTSVQRTMKYLRATLPSDKSILLTINSKIPTAVGLKSSSAVSVAVTKAIFELFTQGNLKPSKNLEILRISCEASIQSGASLTGAFDDAAACLLGGLVFSDNLKFKLLRHVSLNPKIGSIVKILVPNDRNKLTSSLSLETYRKFREQSLEAIEFAQRGVIVQAMLLNSIIHAVIHHYSMQPIVSSIMEGASASGITGKGPAIAAICSSDKISRRVERRWTDENKDWRIITAPILGRRTGDL